MAPGGRRRSPFFKEYISALLLTPQTLRRLAFRRRTLEEELQEALLRGSLRKAFGGWDLLFVGLGIVIGSGWAQLSGFAAQLYAGPSVIISYLVSGLAALLSATCYAELCSEFPVSGGAFSYVLVTFGELAGFVALACLLLEYALGMAAVARGFSSYLARLCNQPADLFIVEVNGGAHSFDFMAAGIILLMSVLLSLGVRESALFIAVFTIAKVALLIFISSMGYAEGSTDNLKPFIDPVYGADGIFLGASVLFFSYTGFDAIGNAAEEAQNVAHLPWAVVGTASVSIVLYVMLSMSLALMAFPSASEPDPNIEGGQLTFITTFIYHSQKWMQYVVCIAALFGILTALTVGLFSLSRVVMAASRDWLLPPFLARISPRTQTPLLATIVFGAIIALLAMLVEVDTATALVSFGTLVVLWLVCNVQMYRRYFPDVQLRFTRYGIVETAPKVEVDSWMPRGKLSLQARKVLVGVHMAMVNVASIALAAYYSATSNTPDKAIPGPSGGHEEPEPPPPPPPLSAGYDEQPSHQGLGCLWFALGWAAVTLSFQLCCPLEYEPTGWHVPWWLMPWLPSAAIGLTVFSVGALPSNDYWKIATYFSVVLLVYLLYSLPMSFIKHSRVDYVNTEELKVVELAFVNGQWQPKRQSLFPPVMTLSPAPSSSRGMEITAVSRATSLDVRAVVDAKAAALARQASRPVPAPPLPPAAPKVAPQQGSGT